MGNQQAKSSLKDAITYLNICAEPIKFNDEKFWDKIWSHEDHCNNKTINITLQEIRMLRDGSPKNFATLTCKMVERVYVSTKSLCNTHGQQLALLNSTKILTKLIPCIFEDPDWRNFFLENQLNALCNQEPELKYPKHCDKKKDFRVYLPTEPGTKLDSSHQMCDNDSISDDNDNYNEQNQSNSNRLNLIGLEGSPIKSSIKANDDQYIPNSLLKTLVIACCDLLFCPELCVPAHNDSFLSRVADNPPEDLQSLASCDYVWEPGVGFESSTNSTTIYDNNRIELLRLLLACFSETLYLKPRDCIKKRNYWVETFITRLNRHALPLFTSLLNTIFAYKPSSRFVTFNSILFVEDNRLNLIELAAQILIISLDYNTDQDDTIGHDNFTIHTEAELRENEIEKNDQEQASTQNLFAEYMSRIHRVEDFAFIIAGFTRLLNDQLEKGYLLSSSQNINLEQELFVLFWKICNLNKRFMNHLLKSQEVLDIVVPILYHMNLNFQDQSKTALIHLGVFNLLVLSGERNFAVRLNKQHLPMILPNLPSFTGTHADLMIIVFHKLILYGYNIYQLFDYMITIIVNISPYVKALSMVASKCLIQLFEIFSSAEVIYTEPAYHRMVMNLLETFNNIIQYQFDGNANLICAILTRKQVFIDLKNLPTTENGIRRVLNRLIRYRRKMLGLDQSNQSGGLDKEGKQQISSVETINHGQTGNCCADVDYNDNDTDADNVNNKSRKGKSNGIDSANDDNDYDDERYVNHNHTKTIDNNGESKINMSNNANKNNKCHLQSKNAEISMSITSEHATLSNNSSVISCSTTTTKATEPADTNNNNNQQQHHRQQKHQDSDIHRKEFNNNTILSQKRAVCLVATPNISDVIQTINPLDPRTNTCLPPATTKRHVSSSSSSSLASFHANYQPASSAITKTTKTRVQLESDDDNESVMRKDLSLSQRPLPAESKANLKLSISDNNEEIKTLNRRSDEQKSQIKPTSNKQTSPTSNNCTSALLQIEEADLINDNYEITTITSDSSATTPNEQLHNNKAKWHPTTAYISHWKASLPLLTTLRTIEVLSPQIDKFKLDNWGKPASDYEIINFVQNGTLVGLLPVPHPILMRKYKTNAETSSWFRVCAWAIIYVKTSIWLGTSIKLLKPFVQEQQINKQK